jgi:hypothetical protein
MYCPSCGTEYSIELKYCNRCGANLNTRMAAPTEIVQVSIAKPSIVLGLIMLILTLGGFGLLMGGAVELARGARLDPQGITGIVITGILAILITDIFLVRLLTKIINASLSAGSLAQPRRSRALPNPSVMPLSQAATPRFQGVPSVTEGTTRFFEPAPTQSEIRDRTTVDKLER